MRLFLSSLTGINYIESMENVIDIAPGDNIANKLLGLTENTLIRFLPGIHSAPHGMNDDKDMVFIDKSNVAVQIMGGAILKTPDNTILIDREGEQAPNQSYPIANFSFQGTYTGAEYEDAAFWIKIDGNGTPDTFKWEKASVPGEPSYSHTGVAITGSWQTLSDGVQIKIDNTTGNTIEQGQIISYGAKDQMTIRVGSADGLHVNYIENVNIFGEGVLDYNIENNAKPTPHQIQLPASVLFHGRLRNCGVYGITMQNCHRSFMAYGEHSGTYLDGGGTSGGESFDMYNIVLAGTKTFNPIVNYGSGVLLGHPEHRGWNYNMRIYSNLIDTYLVSIELNFQLKQYQCYDNMVKTVGKTKCISLWRKSEDGMIVGNSGFDTTSSIPVVGVATSPSGWQTATNIYKETNLNLNASIGN